MVNGATPPEVPIDAELVRRLVAAQFPRLEGLPVSRFGNGWDNEIFSLGDDLLVRMPRREAAVGFARNEHTWLPVLAPSLTLSVPAAVHTGEPGERYPWPWSVVPRFAGDPAAVSPPAEQSVTARTLAAFLRALHVPAPVDAPRNPYRGIPLSEALGKFEIRRRRLAPRLRDEGFDVDRLVHLFMSGMDGFPFDGPRCWMHGDVHPGNVLVHGGEIAAVIDWGDVCAGDPAGDLQITWMLFDRPARGEFLAAYGAEAHLGLAGRARAWAVHSAFVYLDNDEGDPLMTRMGFTTLRRLLD